MNIGETVIPNEDNEEEDLTRCNPNFLPLPAVRLSKGIWLARWTLNEAERKIVAETGDIYIRMTATNGDELISPHKLFVETPNIRQLKEHYAETNKSTVNNKSETPKVETPTLSKDEKDEFRLLIHEEINKAFAAALGAALNYPVSFSDSMTSEKQQERRQRIAVINEIGSAMKNALRDLKDEANAAIVEKTDPARAEIIRKLKAEF